VELKLIDTPVAIYADDVNLLGDNIVTIKKYRETIWSRSTLVKFMLLFFSRINAKS
jgi:hypothetical protein